MMMAKKHAYAFLWLCVGASIFLFSTKYFRIGVGGMYLPVPVFFMLVVSYFLLLGFFMRGGQFSLPRGYEPLIILCSLFILWHLVSAIGTAGSQHVVVREILKITMGCLLLGIIVVSFPRDETFLRLFWKIVLWGSVPFLAYLLYRSLSVGNKYIGADLADVSQKGPRNQIATYIAIIFPVALYYVFLARKKWTMIVPLSVLSISLVYTLSRSGWMCGVFSFALLPLLMWKKDRRKSVKMFAVGVVAVICCAGSSGLLIAKYGNPVEMLQRVLWIYNPSAVSGLHSFESRTDRIAWGLDGFRRAPLFGGGLANGDNHGGGDVHNDYVHILAEMGVVGEVLFLGILFFIGIKVLKNDRHLCEGSWVFLASKVGFINMIFLMNFNTTYSSPYNWIFFGLFLVSAEMENGRREGRVAL